MKKQSAFGFGNCQIMIGDRQYAPMDVYKSIDQLFHEYDEKVNMHFPNKIICSKLNNIRSEFKSSKIFSSLIKIDVPLENAFDIVHTVVTNLLGEIEDGIYDASKFSTHDIRKIVAHAIINYHQSDVSIEEVETWGDRYVRRYGHDSQRVIVYYRGSEEIDEIGYNFIKNTLLEDIFLELDIREKTYRNEISERQLRAICGEIVEFVNDCNMYKIDYNTLKEFIKEMSLQPPHPWFVTSETAKKVCEYDLDILSNHYEKLCNARDNKEFEDLYYRINEAIHHACSSILARYNEVLGCRDLDVFYNLERITRNLWKREYDDLLIENYDVNNLVSDLKYVGVEFLEFYNLLEKIKKQLTIRSTLYNINDRFINNVIELCRIAMLLDNNVNKNNMEDFLYSDWKEYEVAERKDYIKKLFEAIDGLEIKGIAKVPNCFWINRKKLNSEKEIFAICFEERIQSQEIAMFINSRKALLNTEAILIIVEENNDERILNLEKELDNPSYFVEIVDKNDLQKIFMSNKKWNELDIILKKELYS